MSPLAKDAETEIHRYVDISVDNRVNENRKCFINQPYLLFARNACRLFYIIIPASYAIAALFTY